MQHRSQEKIDYLSRAMKAHNERTSINDYISILRERMTGLKGICYEGTDMPKSRNTEKDLSDYAARIDRELRSYRKAAQREQRARRDVLKIIRELSKKNRKEPDGKTRRQIGQEMRLLELRYLDYLKWEDVAAALGYEVAQTFRIHKRAIERVTIPEIIDSE